MSLRFSEELSALHAKLQRLMRRREDLESDLQRQHGKFVFQLGVFNGLIHPPDRRTILDITFNPVARFTCSYRKVEA